MDIHEDLEKTGGKYKQPVFTFEVDYRGVKAKSPEMKLVSWIEFEFGPASEPGQKRTVIFEMPDGSEKQEDVPDDGKVKVASALPGQVIFKGFADG